MRPLGLWELANTMAFQGKKSPSGDLGGPGVAPGQGLAQSGASFPMSCTRGSATTQVPA